MELWSAPEGALQPGGQWRDGESLLVSDLATTAGRHRSHFRARFATQLKRKRTLSVAVLLSNLALHRWSSLAMPQQAPALLVSDKVVKIF